MMKVGVRETLRYVIDSVHCKVALKKQVQVLFSTWNRAYLYAKGRFSDIKTVWPSEHRDQ